MLDKKIFILVLSIGAALWGLSIPLIYLFYPAAQTASEFGEMFGAVNALFSGLALAGVVCTLLLQNLAMRSTQRMLEESIRTTELAARIAAYGWLLQESDNALVRYDRWESTPARTKFAGPKAAVRKNMRRYVKELQALEKQLGNRPPPGEPQNDQ